MLLRPDVLSAATDGESCTVPHSNAMLLKNGQENGNEICGPLLVVKKWRRMHLMFDIPPVGHVRY